MDSKVLNALLGLGTRPIAALVVLCRPGPGGFVQLDLGRKIGPIQKPERIGQFYFGTKKKSGPFDQLWFF